MIEARSDQTDDDQQALLQNNRLTNRMILKDLVKLAVPLTLSGYVQISSGIFSGWLISTLGEDIIAELSLATHTVPLFLTLGSVFAPLPGRLASLNSSENNKARARTALQAAWLGSLLISIPANTGMFFSGDITRLFKQDPKISKAVSLYGKLYMINTPFILLNLNDLAYLEATGKQLYVLGYYVLTSGINISLSYLLTSNQKNLPQLGIAGFSLAQTGASVSGFMALKLLFLIHPEIRQQRLLNLRATSWRPLFYELGQQLKLGLPVMAYRLTLAGQEFFSGQVIGWFGRPQLALNSASGYYLSFLSPLQDGLAAASMVLAGKYLATQTNQEIKSMVKYSMIINLTICCLPIIPYTIFPEPLAKVFVTNTQSLTVSIRGVFGLMLLGWSMEKIKALGAYTLIGMGEVKVPAIANASSDLLIVLLVYLLGSVAKLELLGVDTGICIGFALAMTAITVKLVTRLNEDDGDDNTHARHANCFGIFSGNRTRQPDRVQIIDEPPVENQAIQNQDDFESQVFRHE